MKELIDDWKGYIADLERRKKAYRDGCVFPRADIAQVIREQYQPTFPGFMNYLLRKYDEPNK